MNTVDKVIKLAYDEVGYLEKSKSAYKANPQILYEKTSGAGSDNYTKYGKEMHDIYPSVMDFPAYWCDCFVDWLFQKSYGVANAKGLLGDFDDYTKGSINLYKKKNALFYRGDKEPKAGDQVFFSKDGTFNGVHHTGLVVDVDNNKIYVVEGNTSDGTAVVANGGGVCKKSYNKTDSRIYCYGRPKYDTSAVYPKWVQSGDDWYYRIAEGKNAHGWLDINKHRYYFDAKGKAVKGLYEIEGKMYRFATKDDSKDFECALMQIVEV